MSSNLTFIDLFCGCGGFTLGMERAGLRCLAAVDFNPEAVDLGVEFEFPYDEENFKDQYTRRHRMEPCSASVAYLSKDGLMFIHPTQNRSLTPREATRIQRLPDWCEFPIARSHQFRVIGSAAPPFVAEAIGTPAFN